MLYFRLLRLMFLSLVGWYYAAAKASAADAIHLLRYRCAVHHISICFIRNQISNRLLNEWVVFQRGFTKSQYIKPNFGLDISSRLYLSHYMLHRQTKLEEQVFLSSQLLTHLRTRLELMQRSFIQRDDGYLKRLVNPSHFYLRITALQPLRQQKAQSCMGSVLWASCA